MMIGDEDELVYQDKDTELDGFVEVTPDKASATVLNTPPVALTNGVDSKWYSLRVISGKEKKIQERILKEIENSGWGSFIFNVVVPSEKVYKIRNGKKVMLERNLLPGYILIEAIGAKLNGEVAKQIADITNVIHFLGKETPSPMTQVEANRLLGIVDENTETGETLIEPYLIGETVKIIDGPFAEFVGDIQEVNEEKKKLKVIVKIFGRGTEVELNFLQVEKIS